MNKINSAYHLTTIKDLKNILINGLIPTIGNRSSLIEETTPAIYLFKTIEDLQDGLLNWFEDYFEDTDELVIICIDINELLTIKGADYEIVVSEHIKPDRILYLLDENLNPKSLTK